jgi:large repetitive protein
VKFIVSSLTARCFVEILSKLKAAVGATGAAMLLLFAQAAYGQTSVTNTASITPPPSVTNTNSSPNCASGTCTASDIDAVTPSLPSVSKTFSPASIPAGGTSLLVITFTNSHRLVSATFTSAFTDIYPPGLVNASPTGVTTTCSGPVPSATAGLGTVTMAIGTVIAPNASCSVSVVVTSVSSPQVINTIPAGSLSTSVGANSAIVTATLTISSVADLAITKTASAGSATPGSSFTYTVVIVNNGPSAVAGASWADTLPVGLGTISNVVASAGITATPNGAGTAISGSSTLASGARATVTFQVTVANNASGSLANVAGVTPPLGTTDPTPSNNNSTATVTVSFADVTTVIDLPANAAGGSVVTGTVSFTNNSTATATATAVIGTVTLSNGEVKTFTVPGSLAPGQSFTTTFTTTVPNNTATPTLVGTSTVATSTPESNLGNNSANDTLVVLYADPAVVVNPIPAGTPGSTVTATVTLSNNGSTTVTFTPVIVVNGVTQTLPPVTLAPGQTQSVPVLVTITTSGATVTGIVTNPSVADSNPANNTDTKSTGTLLADVTTVIDLPANAAGGSVVTGTVSFTNNSTATATATAVIGTVTLSNGEVKTFTVPGSLAPGQSFTTTFTTTVPNNTATPTLVGTSTVATSTPESNLGNNSANDTLVVNTVADVSVTISVPSSGTPGQTISSVVTVINNGLSTAQNVSVTVVLPNGSTTTVFTVASLPSGSSATVNVLYLIPAAQTATMSWVANVTTTTAETNIANNIATGTTTVVIVRNATISGRAWLDADGNRLYTANTDLNLSGWKVELIQNGAVVGTATTSADGTYLIGGQIPGGGYSVRFKNPSGQIVVSTPFNQGPVAASGRTTQNGNPSLGTTTSVLSSTATVAGSIDNIVLYAGDNTIDQNLPIDPSGIVYDAVTRLPVAGAIVTLVDANGVPVPAANLLQGSATQTTDATGIYQFDLLPTAPSGRYRLLITPPQGYANVPAAQGGVSQPGIAPNTTNGSVAGGVYSPPNGQAFAPIQPNINPPAVGVNGASAVGSSGTQYFLDFQLNIGGPNQSAGVIRNHVPLDPLVAGALLISKVGDKSVAEVADSVRYTIRVRNTSAANIAGVKVEDLLPAGFRYILGTAQLNGSALIDPAGGVGRALTFNIGVIPANTTWELTYFVRLGVGSQQGDGINRATAVFPGAGGVLVRSNTAQFKVNVQGGVFSNDGCIIGKVYVDCDGSHTQGNESGSRELGIPGVRLVMLDGTYIVTDNEGKYSICGVKPQTHVIKVDRSTLPKGSRLLPSSNRNAGVGDSIFVDIKGGELGRADFIEGSCSPEVLDQVKARRAQGGVLAPEKELRPDLKIDNRPLEVQQQILPSVRPATTGGAVQ